MRSVALVPFAVILVGCNPQLGTPLQESTEAFGRHPDPTHSCLFLGAAGARPLADLWAGQTGYVVYHRLTTYCNDPDAQHYAVLGLDKTMRNVVFITEVADMIGVQYYQHLPGTLPYNCQYTPDAGQVGSQNTNTGGGHWCPDGPCPCEDYVCFDDATIDHLRITCTPCQPLAKADACGGAECGPADDGCGHTISCGTCGRGSTCDTGSCVPSCLVHKCPKGSYFDPDTCGCESGLPQ